MKKVLVFSLLITNLFFTVPVLAQEAINSTLNNPPPEESESKTHFPISHLEYTLSLTVLAFGLLVIILEMYLIKNKKISSDDTIKFVLITLIITSTLFLITAGYSNDQIAPAVGLLGTIAGYLLGRIQKSSKTDDKNEKSS